MIKPHFFAAALAALCLSPAAALATDLALTADLGTTGLGLHVSTPLRQNLNARVGFNYLNYSYNGSTSDLSYDFKLKLNTFDALLDYFPGDSDFRLTGGLVYNNNKIDAIGKPTATGTYTINGTTYSAASAGQLDGKIDFRKVAPYLGIGWGNPVRKDTGWGFSADAGILFQGTPGSSLTNSGCTATPALCSQLATDVDAENIKLHDKVNDLKLYPVLRIGASYRF
ncbi:hypothetical protein [Actimicrobium antarcticum]|uniref:Histidine kinase n=1 Tax=Actimicrobium antarcticum TaxID=1051899 RepID=A0ABP7TYQ8_9BURK